ASSRFAPELRVRKLDHATTAVNGRLPMIAAAAAGAALRNRIACPPPAAAVASRRVRAQPATHGNRDVPARRRSHPRRVADRLLAPLLRARLPGAARCPAARVLSLGGRGAHAGGAARPPH